MALQYFQTTDIKEWMNIGCNTVNCLTLIAQSFSIDELDVNIIRGNIDNLTLESNNSTTKVIISQSTNQVQIQGILSSLQILNTDIYALTPLGVHINSQNNLVNIIVDNSAVTVTGNSFFDEIFISGELAVNLVKPNSGSVLYLTDISNVPGLAISTGGIATFQPLTGNSLSLPPNRGNLNQVMYSNGDGTTFWSSPTLVYGTVGRLQNNISISLSTSDTVVTTSRDIANNNFNITTTSTGLSPNMSGIYLLIGNVSIKGPSSGNNMVSIKFQINGTPSIVSAANIIVRDTEACNCSITDIGLVGVGEIIRIVAISNTGTANYVIFQWSITIIKIG